MLTKAEAITLLEAQATTYTANVVKLFTEAVRKLDDDVKFAEKGLYRFLMDVHEASQNAERERVHDE